MNHSFDTHCGQTLLLALYRAAHALILTATPDRDEGWEAKPPIHSHPGGTYVVGWCPDAQLCSSSPNSEFRAVKAPEHSQSQLSLTLSPTANSSPLQVTVPFLAIHT